MNIQPSQEENARLNVGKTLQNFALLLKSPSVTLIFNERIKRKAQIETFEKHLRSHRFRYQTLQFKGNVF